MSEVHIQCELRTKTRCQTNSVDSISFEMTAPSFCGLTGYAQQGAANRGHEGLVLGLSYLGRESRR
jgi:hypothetical protein